MFKALAFAGLGYVGVGLSTGVLTKVLVSNKIAKLVQNVEHKQPLLEYLNKFGTGYSVLIGAFWLPYVIRGGAPNHNLAGVKLDFVIDDHHYLKQKGEDCFKEL